MRIVNLVKSGPSSLSKLCLLAVSLALLPGMQSRVSNLESRMLASHNHERAKLGVPAMRWNDDLARGAQRWADYLSHTGQFKHSPTLPGHSKEGENIWGGTPGAYSAESMVGLWIAEKRDFQPGTFPRNSATGRVEDVSHYTQLIWRETREVGCALSNVGDEEILVCRYKRPGNVIGEKPL